MKLFKKHIFYFLTVIFLFELFFALGIMVTDGVEVARNVDKQTMNALVEARTLEGSFVMRWVTGMGDYEFVLHTTVIVGLLMAVFGHIEISLGIISGIALTNYLTSIMKRFFHVLRPEDYVVKAGGWSYPSGHASGAAILAIMIIWAAYAAIPKKYRVMKITVMIVAIVYALSVAFSRMYLGVHWLSDVVGGMLLAGAVGVLMIGVLKPVIMKRCSLVK